MIISVEALLLVGADRILWFCGLLGLGLADSLWILDLDVGLFTLFLGLIFDFNICVLRYRLLVGVGF